jgi:hypothetical protein
LAFAVALQQSRPPFHPAAAIVSYHSFLAALRRSRARAIASKLGVQSCVFYDFGASRVDSGAACRYIGVIN